MRRKKIIQLRLNPEQLGYLAAMLDEEIAKFEKRKTPPVVFPDLVKDIRKQLERYLPKKNAID